MFEGVRITADWVLIIIFESLTGHQWERAPVGRVQTGMAGFCKAPLTAKQLEQQQREDEQGGGK